MQDFGPPKGFPDLSKLTGGEFGKMEAPVSHPGGYESGPQYGGGYSGKLRPFGQFSPQGIAWKGKEEVEGDAFLQT